MASLPSARSVFALVIGIDTYEAHDPLEGAVADAEAFAQFLREKLGVHEDHIMNLRDEEATKAGISSAFESLKDNPRIQLGDAIIIYYSGHGSRTPVPKEWADWESNESQIEMICPVDIGSTRGDDQMEIGGIPDRVVGIWLNELSKEKGNNITLIMDCCHSASASRDANDTGLVPRRILNPPAVNPKDWILSSQSRGAGVASGFGGQNQESHILLAACGRGEQAWENPKTKRGLFTTALLETLSNCKLHDLTYSTLFRQIHIPAGPPQTPHCYGRYIGRRVFNENANGADPSFALGYTKDDGTIILDAGDIHGVQPSSKYSIYKSNIPSGPSNILLGFFIVQSITPTASVLVPASDTPSLDIPSRFFAKDTNYGTREPVRVYCNDRERLESILLKALQREHIPSLETSGIAFVGNAEFADLSVSFEGNQVVYCRKEGIETAFVGSRLKRTTQVDNAEGVFAVLRAYAKFNFHLNTTNISIHPISNDKITMELQRLEGEWSPEYKWVVTPAGSNLIGNDQVDVVVDSNTLFGVTIHNHTDSPLYPYLFYFDGSDFGIQVWYVPPIGIGGGRDKNLDAPLLPNAKFTIGYGDGGALPWAFYLPDGQNKDIGFLKLYVTESPSDFSNIIQRSPFDDANLRQYYMAGSTLPPDICSTKTITIFQRREGTPPPVLKSTPPKTRIPYSGISVAVLLLAALSLQPTSTFLFLLAFAVYKHGL
ncbi:hypothetical protein BD410DRAFT_792791 [Rickenella mellea]|uniref:Peptidase C14 caspase domain-containing protein n=1 Tax=Rickenella mellea TaxID=50990 RepID=A0A4Y7PW98_9AGAM|nr:hypothetical protein BD410DRAFT_792791 [Rickenella mellea]